MHSLSCMGKRLIVIQALVFGICQRLSLLKVSKKASGCFLGLLAGRTSKIWLIVKPWVFTSKRSCENTVRGLKTHILGQFSYPQDARLLVGF